MFHFESFGLHVLTLPWQNLKLIEVATPFFVALFSTQRTEFADFVATLESAVCRFHARVGKGPSLLQFGKTNGAKL